MSEPRFELPGSTRRPIQQAQEVRPIDPESPIELTVVLRRRAELTEDAVQGEPLTSRELAARFGADLGDVSLVRDAITAAGAEVLEVDAASRRIRVAGPAGTLAELFGTTLELARTPDPTSGAEVEHRYRQGSLSVPAALKDVVIAVLGLDDRPQARANLRAARAVTTSYTPLDLARIYAMPEGTDGSGQTLAIIELGGGFGSSDLNQYFAGLGMKPPSVKAVGVDGAANRPGADPTGADGEVLLDIEVAGGIAPKSSLVVYFAPNTDAGFLDAVAAATHTSPTPTAMSISWGQSEDEWTAQARGAMDAAFADAAALGITVTAAAGDNGSGDSASDGKAHVDFPAASPHVLACGGTSLHANPSTGAVASETVWNNGSSGGATGGGVSDTFARPSWQNSAGVPNRSGATTSGRGVPDVAGDADPQTGYQVLVDGKTAVYGGTSAVAPLWAALVCRLAQSLGHRVGSAAAGVVCRRERRAYRVPGSATSPRETTAPIRAGSGWDACTGLGVPDGAALLRVLRG